LPIEEGCTTPPVRLGLGDGLETMQKIQCPECGAPSLTEAGEPVVVCGMGMLRLIRVLEDGKNLIPMRRLRVRFE